MQLFMDPPGQNGRHFADDTFKCIFLDENFCISIKILLRFVSKGPIDNTPALVQIIAKCRIGEKLGFLAEVPFLL